MRKKTLRYETPLSKMVRLHQNGPLMVSVFDYQNQTEIIGNDEDIDLDY